MTVIAGRYALGRALGSGAMADVRLAQDLLLGRQVAVKLFRPGLEAARVRQEVRLHARLSHPGLVAVYDSGTDEQGRTFLVLQLVNGPTLAERVRRSPLTAGEAALVGAGLATALAHLHAHGVVHRDVKPANILLGPDGTPHLADLGIAQEQGQDGLTATGFTLGTVPYLSPEQVRGQSATPASDVYALGLVLLEALTGRREYPGMTAEGALARLTRRPVVDSHLTGVWPGLLAAMTADDPRTRPTAAAVAAVLRDPVAGLPVAASPTALLTVSTPVPPDAAAPVTAALLPAAGARRRPHRRRSATGRARRPGRRAAVTASALLLGLGGLVAAGRTGGPAGPPATPSDLQPTTAPVVQPVAVATVPVTAVPPAAPRVAPTASRPTPRHPAAVVSKSAGKGKSAQKGGGGKKRHAG